MKILTTSEIARRNGLLRGVDSIFGHRPREALDGILAGSPKAQQLLHALSPAEQHAARDAASAAFISGFRAAMLVTFLLLSTAAVLSTFLLRPASRGAESARSVRVAAHEQTLGKTGFARLRGDRAAPNSREARHLHRPARSSRGRPQRLDTIAPTLLDC